MPRPRQVEPAALALRFQVAGPQSAQALATALRVDRSSISRALALPALAPQVVRLGTTRGATYALRRPIRGLGTTFTARRIDAEGREVGRSFGPIRIIRRSGPVNCSAWVVLPTGFPFSSERRGRRATSGGRWGGG